MSGREGRRLTGGAAINGIVAVLTLFGALLAGVESVTPAFAAVGAPRTTISAGGYHSLVLKSDGTMWSFGLNSSGQLGTLTNSGTFTPNPTPAEVMTEVATVAAGSHHSLVLKTDGTLWTFGHNYDGQLGKDNIHSSGTLNPTPTQVMSEVAVVAVGTLHSLVLKTDGTLWTFGQERYGKLGRDIITAANPTPTQVMSGVAAIAGGDDHSLVLKTDGTLWTFGSNQYGQLGRDWGIPGGNPNPTPTQVMSEVAAIAAGDDHSLVLKSDGTLWTFGVNSFGQLGTVANLGTYVRNPTPTQVMSDVAAIAAGGDHSLVLKSDGTLWSFGNNHSGELGTVTNSGTYTTNPTPTQVMSEVAAIAAGSDHSLVLKTDGTLWTFGLNSYGQLGRVTYNYNGAGTAHPTPTQVMTGVMLPGAVELCDSDGDGLPDDWEVSGVDFDSDGTIDLDLPGLGADPNHKDLFVEVDWMPGHEPQRLAMDRVVKAFADAPVANPDGSSGIRLHLDAGADYIRDLRTNETWGDTSGANQVPFDDVLGVWLGPGQYSWGEFDTLKAAHFDPARRDVFRYSLFSNRFGSPTGVARGADFMVADFPSTSTPTGESGTFMHELGHTLGLAHGGADGITWKPNYLSVMNYTFQLTGLLQSSNRPLDYSREKLTSLDEASLSEIDGLTPQQSGFYTGYFCGGEEHRIQLVAAAGAIDWNCNGSIDAGRIGATIKQSSSQPGNTPTRALLVGHDDWAHLVFAGGGIGALGDQTQPAVTYVDELTTEMAEAAGLLTVDSLVPLGAPGRVLDSRSPGGATVDGLHQAVGRLAAGGTYELPVAGRAGVPANAASVVLNVTVVSPSDGGFVTVYPCGEPLPNASNLNYAAGQTIPNSVITRVGANGKICLFSHAATDLLVDVSGYFSTVDSYAPLGAPGRVLDTRNPGGTTVDGLHQAVGRIATGGTYELPVAGRAGVPATAASVVLNVTVVSPLDGGFVTVYPCGEPLPNASSLNYAAGQTIPNSVISRVGAGGKVCLFSFAATDLLVDVSGYFQGT
ncbi:MAG: hypothetical protein K8R99_03640 [Actinomycetia bacterium]|nr:hypothetical protein [Actinomycetes bacterium]